MKKKKQKYDSVKALKDAGKQVTDQQESVIRKLDNLIEKVDRIAARLDTPNNALPPQPKPAPANVKYTVGAC